MPQEGFLVLVIDGIFWIFHTSPACMGTVQAGPVAYCVVIAQSVTGISAVPGCLLVIIHIDYHGSCLANERGEGW